ncbi:hypothetical protein COO60DRAFT_664399 [Scenedesmus sp. NREL 46B-D3]|nr:hypothetical protein COO60DRAFT_664399 [Scenedesmus sp. NREL 46B-D3]
MFAVPALLPNGASVDHLASIYANAGQPAGCKDSPTSQQPCNSNSKQQLSDDLHGSRRDTTSAAAVNAAVDEPAVKFPVRSQRAPSSDSQQQQGRTILAYQVTPINVSTGSTLAQPQVLSGTAAIALQTLLMKLNVQRLQEQLNEQQQQQQQQATAQRPEAMQPQHQLQLPAVVKEGGRAVDEAPRAAHAVQQLQQPADPSAALLGALAAAAAAAETQDTLSQLQGGAGVAEDVLALVSKQLLQQEPSAMVEQLHQYTQLQQCLESRPDQQQALSTALGATAGQLQQTPAAEQSLLEFDPLGSSAAAAFAPPNTDRHAGDDPMQRYQQPAEHLDAARQQPDQSCSTAAAAAAAQPSSSGLGSSPPPASLTPAAAGAAGSRKRKRAASRFTGVRRRPWGTWGAEIRAPKTTERFWLGTFRTCEEAALMYDAALREMRGPDAACNLPRPDEETAQILAIKARKLLSRNSMEHGTHHAHDAAAADQHARRHGQELLQEQREAQGAGVCEADDPGQGQDAADDEFYDDDFGIDAAAAPPQCGRRGFGSAVGLAAAAAPAKEDDEQAAAKMQAQHDDGSTAGPFSSGAQRLGPPQQEEAGLQRQRRPAGRSSQQQQAGWQGDLGEYDRQAQQLMEELRLIAGLGAAQPAPPSPPAAASPKQQQQEDEV